MPEDTPEAADAKADVAQRWGGRVPIVIGAAGHRNIRPADGKLAAAVRGECRKLRRQYKASPFVVLSALAEGADRLIAQIAMEELGADLIALLPMPAADYERDFQTQDSKEEFRAFLGRAVCTKIAALAEGDAWKADGEPRNEQYARAGAMIADHSQILFAIWDGQPARGTGSTAHQVEWFSKGSSPGKYALHKITLSPLTQPEPGLLIRVNSSNAQVITSVTGTPADKSEIQSILSRTNTYNRGALRSESTAATSNDLLRGVVCGNFKLVEAAFIKADNMSVYLSRQFNKFETAIYYLAMLSVVSVNFVSRNYYTALLYFALALAIAILSTRAWLSNSKDRTMEDRCLAEAMRILLFWRMAGIARPVWLSYRSRQPGLIHWIPYAVRALEFCQDCCIQIHQKSEDGGSSNTISLVKTHWVDDQKAWFLRKEGEHLKRYAFLTRTARLAVAASLATAAVLAILTFAPNGGALWSSVVAPYGNFWQVALALFAAIEISSRGRAMHLDLAKRYASQRQIFEAASQMLNTAIADRQLDGAATKILEELGEVVLQEQEEWLWLTHARASTQPA